MECPRPGFTNRTANHGLKRAGLADGAEINVNEDSAEHNHSGDIVQHVADRDRPTSKRARALPKNNPGDHKNHGASYDLPELPFLSGIEEAGIGRIVFFFPADDFPEIAHPPRVG